MYYLRLFEKSRKLEFRYEWCVYPHHRSTRCFGWRCLSHGMQLSLDKSIPESRISEWRAAECPYSPREHWEWLKHISCESHLFFSIVLCYQSKAWDVWSAFPVLILLDSKYDGLYSGSCTEVHIKTPRRWYASRLHDLSRWQYCGVIIYWLNSAHTIRQTTNAAADSDLDFSSNVDVTCLPNSILSSNA